MSKGPYFLADLTINGGGGGGGGGDKTVEPTY